MTNTLSAAGFIIFRKINNVIEYLLLEASYKHDLWTPPKGHVDEGENVYQTAFRETLEETGLKLNDLIIYTEFCHELKYKVKPTQFHPACGDKIVTYWLAQLLNPSTPIKLSNEHNNYGWFILKDAQKTAKFNDMQNLLLEAERFICKLN